MKRLRQSWRWYGPGDTVSLSDIRQAGATDVVTALHDIPNGTVWPIEKIQERKKIITDAGLKWSVVESIPVHEDIKLKSGQWKTYVDNYKESIINVGRCGIEVVTYNFMPVVDWSRTDLSYELPNGSKALRFEADLITAFDAFVLERKEAWEEISADSKKRIRGKWESLSREEIGALTDNIVKGLPGATTSARDSLSDFRQLVNSYEDVDQRVLKNNLFSFIQEIAPVAEEANVLLAIHPDDPPYPIFGLPRIVSTEEDLSQIINCHDSPSNGLCFCTGSLGVRPDNDLVGMIERFSDRLHFIHLRSTKRDEQGNFFEADHLDGDVDMAGVMKALIDVQQNREYGIPYRPDHGHKILDDLDKKTNPGYSAIGRLKGLAELRGLERGIAHML